MTKVSKRLLVQEVRELTALLREEPILADLRDLMNRKKLNPSVCLLAGFMESLPVLKRAGDEAIS